MPEEKSKKTAVISGSVSVADASAASDKIGSWSGNPQLRVKVYEVNEPSDKKKKNDREK